MDLYEIKRFTVGYWFSMAIIINPALFVMMNAGSLWCIHQTVNYCINGQIV